MKGEEPKPSRNPLDPSVSSFLASFVETQNQDRPMTKKASTKKKKQKKIVANSATKKGKKKKKRPT